MGSPVRPLYNRISKVYEICFTGHLAFVLVFTIGAGGYTYSEWLKEVPADFPAALLLQLLSEQRLTYSPPVTLLKPADTVYFFPLEHKLDRILNGLALVDSFTIALPFILYIVALPLLSATGTGIKDGIYLVRIFHCLSLKWMFVETEYYFRHALNGEGIWVDRAIRFFFAAFIIYFWLTRILLNHYCSLFLSDVFNLLAETETS